MGVTLLMQYIFECSLDFSLNWSGPLMVIQTRCLRPLIGVVLQSLDPLWDTLIAILPLRTIVRLHLPLDKKLMVAGVFGVGALSVAASFVRLGMNLEVMIGMRQNENFNIELSHTEFWQLFEAGFAVTTACLPNIHSLVRMAVEGVRARYGSLTPAYKTGGSTPLVKSHTDV